MEMVVGSFVLTSLLEKGIYVEESINVHALGISRHFQ